MAASNLTVRILFGVVAAPLFIFALWAGGHWREAILTFILGAGVWEFSRLLRFRFPAVGRLPESILPTLAVFCAWMSSHGPLNALGLWRDPLLATVAVFVLLWGMRRLPRDDVFPWVGLTLLGFAYIGGWGSSLFGLSHGPSGWVALAPLGIALGICWVGDTTAYAVGRTMGRHKLCPELSPGKTIEGAVGGVIGPAVFCGFAGSAWLGLTWESAAILGAALGGIGILGDLSESILKRWAGAKDSSQIFPGHGGVLDRFDSLFLVAPILHFFLQALR